MAELSPEARNVMQGLMLCRGQRDREQKISLKKKREESSLMLLKAQGIKYGEKCSRCELNCVVKHEESVAFWANLEGIEPLYVIDQRDEIIEQIVAIHKVSREEAGKRADNAVNELMLTGMSKPEALTELAGYSECPKQGHVEKAKLKHKRRKK